MTFTPGPWTVKPGLEHAEVVIADKYDLPVADCPTYGAGMVPSQWVAPWHVAGGNARLIAAAPDLLEACKAAHQMFCDSMFIWGKDDDKKVGHMTKAIALAIKKAEAP